MIQAWVKSTDPDYSLQAVCKEPDYPYKMVAEKY
jgi:hypothetical protein